MTQTQYVNPPNQMNPLKVIRAAPIESVVPTVPGSGYSTATIAFDGDGGATGTVVLARKVSAVVIDDDGAFYTQLGTSAHLVHPTTLASVPCTVVVTSGNIASITPVDPDIVYPSAPAVVIEGDGSGAVAHTTLATGYVDSVTVTDPGLYLTTPTGTISGNGTAAEVEVTLVGGEPYESVSSDAYIADLGAGAKVVTVDGHDYVVGPEYVVFNYGALSAVSANSTLLKALVPGTGKTFVSSFDCQAYIGEPNDGDNGWIIRLASGNATLTYEWNTSSGDPAPSPLEWIPNNAADLGVLLDGDRQLVLSVEKDGTPGTLNLLAVVRVQDILRQLS